LSGGTPIKADHLMIDMHEHISNIEDFDAKRKRVAAR